MMLDAIPKQNMLGYRFVNCGVQLVFASFEKHLLFLLEWLKLIRAPDIRDQAFDCEPLTSFGVLGAFCRFPGIYVIGLRFALNLPNFNLLVFP